MMLELSQNLRPRKINAYHTKILDCSRHQQCHHSDLHQGHSSEEEIDTGPSLVENFGSFIEWFKLTPFSRSHQPLANLIFIVSYKFFFLLSLGLSLILFTTFFYMFDFFLFIIDADWYPCRIFVVLRLGVMLLDLGIRLEEDT